VKERDDNAMDRLTAPKKKPRPPQLAERKFAPKKGALGRITLHSCSRHG